VSTARAGAQAHCGRMNDAGGNRVIDNDITIGNVPAMVPVKANGVVNNGGRVAGNLFQGNDYHVPSGQCSAARWNWWDGVQRYVEFSAWKDTYRQDLSGTCGR
jgi:hypothetical protein